jgi:hypothetical protein
MGTRNLVSLRTGLLAVVVSAGGVPGASADPIVYFNLSNIFGVTSISRSGTEVVHDGYSSGQTLPNTGSWTIEDGVAVGQLGASAAASASLDITVSHTRFSGSGRSSSSIYTDDASGNIVAEAFSMTFFGVLFRVTEPTAYDYALSERGTRTACCGPSIR